MISSEELRLRVIRLIDLIAIANQAIFQHSGLSRADAFQAEQYSRLKSRYEKELLELLATELDMRIPVAA